MIECIFTIDYEIYGNGEGALRELVYEPTKRLKKIFNNANARLVVFVEAAELEMIDGERTDPYIDLVKAQVRELYEEGYEIGLHLHPQWYNARYANRRWHLDYAEYNLCNLTRERVTHIVDRAISYLRGILSVPDFITFSFRAGNWLFKPTQPAAEILVSRGIKVDSSVFKGGLRHEHGLDYRRAMRNGSYWKFADIVDVPDQKGSMIELPIYSRMVPFWRLLNSKRINMEQKGASSQTGGQRLHRLLDLLRFFHPLKLDFCRMTSDELIGMMEEVLREDRNDPAVFRPIVAIGHTKEMIDFATVDKFLSYLRRQGISVSTIQNAYPKCT